MMCFIRSTMQLLICFFVIASAKSVHSLLNQKITTLIDVSTQLVKINNHITIENKKDEPITSYLFIVDPQWKFNLAYIDAFDGANNTLTINRIDTSGMSLNFEILLYKPLSPGKTEDLKVVSVIINHLQSYPKSIKQTERHLVLFQFNVYFYSPYFTKIQTPYVYLGTPEIVSVNGAKYKSANASQALQYGPYYDVLPLSEVTTVIHYENISPFLTIEKLDRFVQISHWGFLTVWEKILLRHTGPKIKGPFEREHGIRKTLPTKDTRIESFTTSLPGDAFDISLKDEIGLLSSFTIDDIHPNKIEVNIRPRFVLYGGWKTYYEIKYSLPVSNYINHNSSTNTFVLSIPVVDRIFYNMIIKEAEMTFILPEGGSFQDLNPYYELENNTDNANCYFFDVICRKVVSFKRYNLLEHHVQNVSLKYAYPQILMLTKPLVISVYLFVVFLLFLILSGSCFNSTQKTVFKKLTKPPPTLTQNNKPKKYCYKSKVKKR